jgi:predicted ATPase/DNA-binding SARP family transcriptional activator
MNLADPSVAEKANHVLRFAVFGTFRVNRDGIDVDLTAGRERLLLGLLAVRPNEVVHRDELVEVLWGGRAPRSAYNLVQTYVARLRRRLEPDRPPRHQPAVLLSLSGGYRLSVDDGRLDLLCLRHLAAEAGHMLRGGDHEAAFDLLDRAFALSRHETLADLRGQASVVAAVAAVEEERRAVCLDFVRVGVELGRYDLVLPAASQLAALMPLHETAQAQHLLALAGSGRQGAALQQFESVRVRLRTELGVEPGAELVEAHRRVLRHELQAAAAYPGTGQPRATAPAPQPLAAPAVPLNWRGARPSHEPLVGRGDDLRAVLSLLLERRLVTLSGPPGCGKTALALHAADTAAGYFPGGVRVIELAEVQRPDEVAAVIGATLVGPTPSTVDDLASTLRGGDRLLLVDSAEHVVDRVATYVDRLVRACPTVSVLVTSREPLGLAAETVWPVRPLPAPPEGGGTPEVMASPAGELFVRRAGQADPGFSLDEGNAAMVVTICRRLDGLPLALELAAASLRTTDLATVCGRLDDRFRLLIPVRRGCSAHQHTFAAALRHSYDRLPLEERVLLARLATLGSEFGFDEATAVAHGPPLAAALLPALLDRLVHKSLLEWSSGRYRLLESIRAFAHLTGEA